MTQQMEHFREWRDREYEKGANGAFGDLTLRPMDFNVQVLTQGWWPTFPYVGLQLPSLLDTYQRAFEQYFFQSAQNKYVSYSYEKNKPKVD